MSNLVGEFPKLTKVNSVVVGDTVFWLQVVSGSKAYIAWRYPDGMKICCAAPKEKTIRLLKERYESTINR